MNIPKTKQFIINHFGLPIDCNIVLYRGYSDCKGIFIESANPTHLKYIWGIRKNKIAHKKGNKYVRVGKVLLPSMLPYIRDFNFNVIYDGYISILSVIYYYDVMQMITIFCNFTYILFVALVIFYIGGKLYDT